MDYTLDELHNIMAFLELLQNRTEDQELKRKLEDAIYKVYLVEKHIRTR